MLTMKNINSRYQIVCCVTLLYLILNFYLFKIYVQQSTQVIDSMSTMSLYNNFLLLNLKINFSFRYTQTNQIEISSVKSKFIFSIFFQFFISYINNESNIYKEPNNVS